MRALAKNPAFSLAVVGVLTLGIGLNAAVFTMLKGLALSPLAGVEGSARLGVVFGETSTGRDVAVSYPDYQYLRDHDDSFSSLFGSRLVTAGLGRGRGARSIWAELVTGNFFQALGVRAELGRTLLPSDEIAPSRQPVVVISDSLWRRDFGADPDIVGRTLEINNVVLTVVGVSGSGVPRDDRELRRRAVHPGMMAPQLGFKFRSQESTPAAILADRRANILYLDGRLRPETTLANAIAQTDAAWATLARDRSLNDAVQRLRVVPFWRSPQGAQTYLLPTLIVLSAMSLLVLTIACANIAGLVLVRGLSRRGEIAVRLALGATRARIVRLLIAENLVLAAPGAAFGVLLAQRGIPMLVGYAEKLAAPERLFFNIGVDSLVIGFAALVACGSALVFGFVPALQSSRVDLVSVINEDASPRGAARGRLRAGLVIAQVAVSLLLLVGAGLTSRSVEAARRANPGFDPTHLTAIDLDVKQNAYDETRGRVFYRKLLATARADAGVESATLAAYMPMSLLDKRAQRVAIEGYEPRRGEDLAFMSNVVGSDYFRTLRIDVIAGREFEDRDDETAAPVAMVNATLAQRFWGGAANAIGKRLRVGDRDSRAVVGVAADVKYARINELPRPYFYLPFLQSYRSSMVLHTRGSAPVDRLVDQARGYVEAIDADLPIQSAKPMTRNLRGAFLFFDLTATMLFIFGVAGMALAAYGHLWLVSQINRARDRHPDGARCAAARWCAILGEACASARSRRHRLVAARPRPVLGTRCSASARPMRSRAARDRDVLSASSSRRLFPPGAQLSRTR
jgi:predicted permease